MLSSDYFCRKATANDSIDQIARCIYQTDPYIYPAICKNPDSRDWKALIRECFRTKNNIYYYKNISVIVHGDQIAGIACIVPCGKNLTIDKGFNIPGSFTDGFNTVVSEYFQPLIEETLMFEGSNIINFCIDEQYRKKGLGKLLMSYCIEQYGSQTMHLDVVASNEAAIRLYKKFGFTFSGEYVGFSGTDEKLLCYHMVRSSNNN